MKLNRWSGDITNGMVIWNPTAARGKMRKIWPAIESRLREMTGGAVRVIATEEAGHAERLARKGAREGYAWIGGCGGDGTLQEVVNGLCRARIEDGVEGIPALLVIPGGTGNDYARSLGLPLHPLRSLAGLNGVVREIDAGRVGNRYFINVGGVGFDAEVAAEVQRMGRRWIGGGGAIPYLWAAGKTLLHYRNVPVSLEIDEIRIERRILMVAVGIGSQYAGGMKILPHADPGDGWLDVCVCGDVSRLQVCALMAKVFSGSHLAHPRVETFRARKIRIQGAEALHVHADGEMVGTLPVEFACLPRTLRVLAPVHAEERQNAPARESLRHEI